MIDQNPVSGYSKGSRGLSVLLWEIGIFTNNIISPSPLLRQRSNRYAIRAGRNLPDKEFRYLRTVIVTAAETCVFSKQSLEPFYCNPFALKKQVLSRYWGTPYP